VSRAGLAFKIDVIFSQLRIWEEKEERNSRNYGNEIVLLVKESVSKGGRLVLS